MCPGKASMFSRRQSCRGKSQNPVVWIAEAMETKAFEAYRQTFRREGASHRAVTKVNADVAPKVSGPEGRAPNRRAKAT